jgi:type I restriction enzyme M protein
VVLPDGSLFGEGVKTRLKEHLMEECNLHTIVRLPNSVFRPYASIGTNLLFFEKGEPTQGHLVLGTPGARGPEGLLHDPAHPAGASGRLRRLVGRAAREGREETERAWKVSAEEVKARGYNLDIKNPHTVAEDHGDPETLLEDLTAAEAEVAALRDQLKAILSEALRRRARLLRPPATG